MCNNRAVSFCGNGDGASEDGWEILMIIVVGETQPGISSKKKYSESCQVKDLLATQV